MVRLYKCLNERGISGYGSLNGLADEAVPLCWFLRAETVMMDRGQVIPVGNNRVLEENE